MGTAPATHALLAVLEVAKAVYEGGYEPRYRSARVAVRVQALERPLAEGAR